MSIFDQRLDLEDSNTIKGSKKEMLHGNEKVLKLSVLHSILSEIQLFLFLVDGRMHLRI